MSQRVPDAALTSTSYADTMLKPLMFASALSLPFLAAAQQPATIVEVLQDNDSFSTLLQAIDAAGLNEALAGQGPFTLFAPTNDAFATLPEGQLNSLLADPEALTEVLEYHVVPERVLLEDVEEFLDDSAPETGYNTLQGTALTLDIEEDTDPTIIINNVAGVTQTDIVAGNGVVQVINAVLMPGVSSDGAEDTMSGSSGGASSGN